MAVCTGCGADSARVKSSWNDDGRLPDICPSCSPESFEKFTAPSDKKIWMGYEAHPNEYEKRYDKEGLIYERKPEYRHEQESILSAPTTDESDAQKRAETKKRQERRTRPMDESERLAAIAKAEQIASWMTGRNVN